MIHNPFRLKTRRRNGIDNLRQCRRTTTVGRSAHEGSILATATNEQGVRGMSSYRMVVGAKI